MSALGQKRTWPTYSITSSAQAPIEELHPAADWGAVRQ
jgi:hypothetical protein